ncbi:MAG: hypothetical protein REI96_21110 [Flavobacterium nitrogenifigens]|uniref:hypothetical protein n=1 Tax=Flavobacterium nitrogenifigens TaxID=1617283 RepID=UPI002808B75F|nr:hypothetical protein [Flavobacterium nitrogenifigens]MDQ8014958.1 hypothetical protein [Flavobacterium nitrogenifigens]
MKNIKLDTINIFLAIVLVALIILYFATRFKNKEQDKMFWNAEIHSTSENPTAKNSNTIQIIDATFYSNFNHSKSDIDSDSKRVTSVKSENSVLFKIWQKELLPDSLNIKYFSIDERKFYQLKTQLSYEKMKNLIKEKETVPILILEIQPLGKILLKIIPNEKQNREPIFLERFIAKETEGNLDMLVYEESLGEKYNRYESIQNITDYADLLQNQYKWSVKIEMEEQDALKSVYAYSFTNEKIYSSENANIAVSRNIPQIFYIYWINKKEYNIQYELSPFEILSAFRKLNESASSGDIILTFKVHKNSNAECKISRNGIVIPLKDKYPSKPY